MRNHDANNNEYMVFGSRITVVMCNGISLAVAVAAAVSCSFFKRKEKTNEQAKIRDGEITTKANIMAFIR